MNRRRFLSTAAGAAAAAALLPSCSGSAKTRASATSLPRGGLGDPRQAPFDTVVLLTMENRSFDHLLGWFPGADGRQAGLTYADSAGTSHRTWPIAPDWQGWRYADPLHDWQSAARQWDHGANDGFLK